MMEKRLWQTSSIVIFFSLALIDPNTILKTITNPWIVPLVICDTQSYAICNAHRFDTVFAKSDNNSTESVELIYKWNAVFTLTLCGCKTEFTLGILASKWQLFSAFFESKMIGLPSALSIWFDPFDLYFCLTLNECRTNGEPNSN